MDLAHKIHSIPSIPSHPGMTELIVYCREIESRVQKMRSCYCCFLSCILFSGNDRYRNRGYHNYVLLRHVRGDDGCIARWGCSQGDLR